MIRVTIVYEYTPDLKDYDGATTEHQALEIDRKSYDDGDLETEDIGDVTSVTWEIV